MGTAPADIVPGRLSSRFISRPDVEVTAAAGIARVAGRSCSAVLTDDGRPHCDRGNVTPVGDVGDKGSEGRHLRE